MHGASDLGPAQAARVRIALSIEDGVVSYAGEQPKPGKYSDRCSAKV